MAIIDVLRVGHPLLLQRAVPIEAFDTPQLHALITDMRDTMAALNGAGLAAPQIGVSQRLVIFGLEHNPRYPEVEAIAETILINPVIDVLDEQTEDGWEGCLSIPGMRGKVPRYRAIRYHGFDAHGNFIEREVDGFHARVVQHECDHLDGILYPQRIVDMRDFGFEEELGERDGPVE
jgi:peptide deformylase